MRVCLALSSLSRASISAATQLSAVSCVEFPFLSLLSLPSRAVCVSPQCSVMFSFFCVLVCAARVRVHCAWLGGCARGGCAALAGTGRSAAGAAGGGTHHTLTHSVPPLPPSLGSGSHPRGVDGFVGLCALLLELRPRGHCFGRSVHWRLRCAGVSHRARTGSADCTRTVRVRDVGGQERPGSVQASNGAESQRAVRKETSRREESTAAVSERCCTGAVRSSSPSLRS